MRPLLLEELGAVSGGYDDEVLVQDVIEVHGRYSSGGGGGFFWDYWITASSQNRYVHPVVELPSDCLGLEINGECLDTSVPFDTNLYQEYAREAIIQEFKNEINSGILSDRLWKFLQPGEDGAPPAVTFQEVFGEDKIFQISFDVARLGEHTHFIYIPKSGMPPLILSGNGDGSSRAGQNGVSTGSGALSVLMGEWQNSPHAPNSERDGDQRIRHVLTSLEPKVAWEKMTALAHEINVAQLSYNILNLNSISVANSLAKVGELYALLPADGLRPGFTVDLTCRVIDCAGGGVSTYPDYNPDTFDTGGDGNYYYN